MTGNRVRGALAAVVAATLLCGCQPRPVEGIVVDKYTYPDGGRAAQPTAHYVSVRSDADPDGPTSQIEVDEDLWRDLEVGDRFDELEMVGP